MENAADALKMAAAFLIFIMALAISINAFSQARLTATTLLEYHDRDYDYRYIEANVDDSGNPVTETGTLKERTGQFYKNDMEWGGTE